MDLLNKYRVTVEVTVDVEASSYHDAAKEAESLFPDDETEVMGVTRMTDFR